MSKKLLEITAEIVQAQASVGKMTPEEIELTLVKTFATLQRIQNAEEGGIHLDGDEHSEDSAEEKPPERIGPKESIQENKVICLECGVEMRQLTTKHLSAHGLNPREYKKKWGFPLKQSLSAKALSKARSKAAKKRGLPANLVKFQEERKKKNQEPAPVVVEMQESGSKTEPRKSRRPRKSQG